MSTSMKQEICTPESELYDIEAHLLNSLNGSIPYSSCSPEASGTSVSDMTSMSGSPEPTSEKKPVKKRKSWGQELPTPTTNLPPR